MRSSREALLILKFTTITTDRLSEVKEDPRYLELQISFYSPAPEDNSKIFKKKDFKVIMPRSWSPKMYLGALYQSIRTNSLLTLKSMNISGQNYTTINKLNLCSPCRRTLSTQSCSLLLLTCMCMLVSLTKSIRH